MLVYRNWTRHVLTASAVAALVAAAPAVAVANGAMAHPEGTLKLASRQLVSGSTVLIRGEMFAERGKLQLLLVSVAGRFQLGEVTADSVGGFAESLEVPANLALGAYRLVAIATDEDEVASLNVELLAAAPEADEENEHAGAGAGAANHSEDGEHAEAAAPTDEPLSLDRAGSPLVTGGAVVAILLALVTGGLLLRRPQGVT